MILFIVHSHSRKVCSCQSLSFAHFLFAEAVTDGCGPPCAQCYIFASPILRPALCKSLQHPNAPLQEETAQLL